MDNNCQKFSLMIYDYIDGCLNSEEVRQFEDHIFSCESCNKDYNISKLAINTMNETKEIDLPENFNEKLREKLLQVNKPKNSKIIFYSKIGGAIAACFLILLITKFSLDQNNFKKDIKFSYNQQNLKNSEANGSSTIIANGSINKSGIDVLITAEPSINKGKISKQESKIKNEAENNKKNSSAKKTEDIIETAIFTIVSADIVITRKEVVEIATNMNIPLTVIPAVQIQAPAMMADMNTLTSEKIASINGVSENQINTVELIGKLDRSIYNEYLNKLKTKFSNDISSSIITNKGNIIEFKMIITNK